MVTEHDLPELISTEEQLDNLLSTPYPELVRMFAKLEGDMIFLGAGGKIGPSLTCMAARASQLGGKERKIYAVVRRQDPVLEKRFGKFGITVIHCDLMDREAVAKLPEVENVVYLAAMKFGTTGQESRTWALNTYLPGIICERYPRSRIVAYSTGNVYPFVSPESGGSEESDPPSPVGEYAMSCLGRERIFTYFSQQNGTPVALLRLNYAHELRYGVMVDIAKKVWDEKPIDLGMAYFNAIWQQDANNMALRALEHVASPPRIINIAGPDILRVRDVAIEFGKLFGKPVHFTSTEGKDALLSDGRLGYELLGHPRVTPTQMIRWIAHWIESGGRLLNKPTKFEVRNGRF